MVYAASIRDFPVLPSTTRVRFGGSPYMAMCFAYPILVRCFFGAGRSPPL